MTNLRSLWAFLNRPIVLGPTPSDSKVIASAGKNAGHDSGITSEKGLRPNPENQIRYLYRQMWVDMALRTTILDIRRMDAVDPRVKRIHGRMARTATKGGLIIDTASTNKRVVRLWEDFTRRLKLHRMEKLESDCRGLVMEGNLPLQWVLDESKHIVNAVRMPSETMVPLVGENGRFIDPRKAYEQHDIIAGKVRETFALWQLSMVRLTPDNYDDLGSLGRPYMDASRGPWKKLVMTEEDLVIRRHQRAPMRMAHFLDGAVDDELTDYENKHQEKDGDITSNYYSNRKGSVTAIQGDENLDHIKDVVHLLDTFFTGAPAPKGLFGYADDLQRDILEDMKQDYFDEIDALQDTLAYGYQLGFELDLLLRGLNPDAFGFEIKFKERRTETPNQAADRALKIKALGGSEDTVMKIAGLSPEKEREQRKNDSDEFNPYPSPNQVAPRVSITPGNRPKGESATDINNDN